MALPGNCVYVKFFACLDVPTLQGSTETCAALAKHTKNLQTMKFDAAWSIREYRLGRFTSRTGYLTVALAESQSHPQCYEGRLAIAIFIFAKTDLLRHLFLDQTLKVADLSIYRVQL